VEVAYLVKIEVPVNAMLDSIDKLMTEHMREFNSKAEAIRHFVLPRDDELPGRTPQFPEVEEWLTGKLGPMVREELVRAEGKPVSEPRHAPSDPLAPSSKFRHALEELINELSMEAWSNTPDFILAHFLTSCLIAFDKAVVRRDEWYIGRKMEPGQGNVILRSSGPDQTGTGDGDVLNLPEPVQERILPSWNNVTAERMDQAVHQALGAASVCWTEAPEGTFLSQRAVRIGRELMETIVDFAQQYAKDREKSMTNVSGFQAIARNLVFDYVQEHLDKSDPPIDFTVDNVFVVWFSKTLQNWKALVSTTLPDGMYYEVTFDGSTKRAYLDAYRKVQNISISLGQDEKSEIAG
jgi:Family of unknown function (DUF6275)